MPTKKKSERSFAATQKYNEYMRLRYARKRQAEGKPYTPQACGNGVQPTVPTQSLSAKDSARVQDVLAQAIRKKLQED